MPKTANRQSRSDKGDGSGKTPTPVGRDLSYSEAQTALELTLAQLQASDLPVETMGELYQRARGYADHCEQLLNQVEQSINVWDPEQAETAPRPLES
jgi:exodeoxyribonuclease VII small subunit